MAIDTSRRTDQVPGRSRRRPALASTALALLTAVLASGALAVGLVMRALSLVSASAAPEVDGLVEVAVCAGGALVAGWLAASALVALGCTAVRLVGSSWRLGERLVHRWAPAVVRRSLLLVVSATVGLGAATGASAAVAPTPAPSASTVAVTADDLGWVVTTPAPAFVMTPAPTPTPAGTPAAGASASAAPAPTAVPEPAPAPTPPQVPVAAAPTTAPLVPSGPTSSDSAADGTVTVSAGDSLWAIAARHLAPDATDAEIAASWPAWYHANAAVIGPDPGHIVPGQELTVPAGQGGASS